MAVVSTSNPHTSQDGDSQAFVRVVERFFIVIGEESDPTKNSQRQSDRTRVIEVTSDRARHLGDLPRDFHPPAADFINGDDPANRALNVSVPGPRMQLRARFVQAALGLQAS